LGRSATMFIERIVLGLPAVKRKVAVETSHAIVVLRTRVVAPAGFDQLFGLALPALAAFVRPAVVERRFPRANESFAHRVLAQLFAASQRPRNAGVDCPSTMRSVAKVLDKRVVARLPAIEVRIADETGDIVGVVGRRLVGKASLGELPQNRQYQ